MALVFVSSCSSRSDPSESVSDSDHAMYGSIAYPFVKGRPLGINSEKERFILRSRVGSTEYVVEIPRAAEDYDVEVPLATSKDLGMSGTPQGLPSPVSTDREMLSSMPSVSRSNPSQANLIDKAFGVGENLGPEQSPSYTLGLSKIGDLYKRKEYEFALIEINDLLSFYPNSTRLYKMKGSILMKLQDYALAERSWRKAVDLDPNDHALQQSLIRLQKKIEKSSAPQQP